MNRRITVDLTEAGAAALDRLSDGDRGEAVNHALRLAAVVQGLTAVGRLTVVRPDGTPIDVHLR